MKKNNLQFISHYTEKYSYADSVRMALRGGCRWIQLRMKDAADEEVERVAREVMPLCREAGATFVVDDRVELALWLGADGVHLGRGDMPVDEARRLAGGGFIIGGTANTFDDIRRLDAQGADYIGCGPYRYTETKKNLAPLLGLDGYRTLLRRMGEAGINLPLIAIGGIATDDIPALLRAGVTGIALSGSVLRAADPVEEMARVVAAVERECENLNR